MKIILYVLLCIAALLVLASMLLSNWETKRRSQAYGLEAVKALAMDAASTFPTVKGEHGDRQFWPPTSTPCVFTTNVVQVHGNSRRVSWENWPSGKVASCSDFYAPETGTYDMRTTLPGQCLPAMTIRDIGGPALSFLAVVATDAKTDALEIASLSQERQNALAKLGKLSNYYYTNNFIRGGGLDGVSVELIEIEACDGFSIFRFQTEVEHPESMRPQLEENGYFVGLK